MTLSPQPSAAELFIKYLKFLKETGIKEVSLTKNSKKFLSESVAGRPGEKRKPHKKDPLAGTPAVVLAAQAVRLSVRAGTSVSRLVCICEKLPDKADQQRADHKLCDIIEKGMELKMNDVAVFHVEFFTGPPEQVKNFHGELRNKIISADPLVILSMGDLASSFLFNRHVDVLRERGKWGEFEGVKVMPTLHSDYIVKNHTTKVRRDVFGDIKKVKGELR